MQTEPPKADPPKRKRRWFQFSLGKAIVAILVVLLLLAGYAAYCVYDIVTVVVPDCYTQEWVAALVIEHMKENGDRWPSGWNDLAETYRVLSHKTEIPWPFDELRRRVDVRFDVDPKSLRSAIAIDEQPPFQVIRLRGGGSHHWQGMEPNRMIWDYLNEKSK
jgi:hypothetical protein